MIGLITTARHEREIAAKDAEIAGLMKRLDSLRQAVNVQAEAARYYSGERDKLRARLAIFTGPRQRDAKGHFLPAKGRE